MRRIRELREAAVESDCSSAAGFWDFALAFAPHAVFGRLITLTIGDQPARRLTAREAVTLARALAAADRGDASEIYMSPIASDYGFDAEIEADGIAVTMEEGASAGPDWRAMRAGGEAH